MNSDYDRRGSRALPSDSANTRFWPNLQLLQSVWSIYCVHMLYTWKLLALSDSPSSGLGYNLHISTQAPNAGRSGLVACLTAVHEVLGSNHAVGSFVYCKSHCDLQRWAQPVCTLPAVPRSTQPSTLRGMVTEYQLSGWVIIINGDGGCRQQQPTGGLTAQVRWLGLRVGGRLALFSSTFIRWTEWTLAMTL